MLGKCLNRLHGSFSRKTRFFVREKASLKSYWLHPGKHWKLGLLPFLLIQDLPLLCVRIQGRNDCLSFLVCKGLKYKIILGTSLTLT